MKWFSSEYLDFFKRLAANNNKDWFHNHKKEYEKYVREPMKSFTAHMIDRFAALEPEVKDLPAHKCLFRINNDIRFNPKKPLYKTHMAAAISKGGPKDAQRPGFYYQLGPGESFLAGGCYQPGKEGLYKIRMAIKQQPKKFHKLIEDLAFRDVFGGLAESEKHKRLPREFKEAADDWPILYNKQFYYTTTIEPKEMLKEDFDDWVYNQFLAAEEVREFLRQALN
jgi:uncharacterized protein (TIGR02453 family)